MTRIFLFTAIVFVIGLITGIIIVLIQLKRSHNKHQHIQSASTQPSAFNESPFQKADYDSYEQNSDDDSCDQDRWREYGPSNREEGRWDGWHVKLDGRLHGDSSTDAPPPEH